MIEGDDVLALFQWCDDENDLDLRHGSIRDRGLLENKRCCAILEDGIRAYAGFCSGLF